MEFSARDAGSGRGTELNTAESPGGPDVDSSVPVEVLMGWFDQLDVSLDQVAHLDVDSVDDEDLLWAATAAARLAARADAMRSRFVDRVDTVGAAAVEGIGSTGSWLKHAAQMTGRNASREVKRARVLRQLPAVAEAYAAGVMSTDQVDVFVRCHNPRTADAMSRDEELLLALAEAASVDRFAAELRGWAALVDTDGVDPDPGHTARGLSMAQGLDGAWSGTFTLGSGDGATIAAAIDKIAEQYRQADRRDGVTRTASQRRADAFRALVLGQVSTHVTLNVVVRADEVADGVYSSKLACDSTAPSVGGTWISAADTLRWSADAAIRAAVTDPEGGAVLHFGRSRRVASPAQKVALSIETDGVCGFTGCDHKVDDVHHIVEWVHGGATDTVNMVGLCWEHHDEVHLNGWTVTKASDGTLTWRRSDGEWIDPLPGWARRHAPPRWQRRQDALHKQHVLRRLELDRAA